MKDRFNTIVIQGTLDAEAKLGDVKSIAHGLLEHAGIDCNEYTYLGFRIQPCGLLGCDAPEDEICLTLWSAMPGRKEKDFFTKEQEKSLCRAVSNYKHLFYTKNVGLCLYLDNRR